jgi:hypothetical protein
MNKKTSPLNTVLQLFARVVAMLRVLVTSPAYAVVPVPVDPLQHRQSILLHGTYRRRQRSR